jgi:hypothetical protein
LPPAALQPTLAPPALVSNQVDFVTATASKQQVQWFKVFFKIPLKVQG